MAFKPATPLSIPTNPSIDPLGGSTEGFMSIYEPQTLAAIQPPTIGSFATKRNNIELGIGDGVPVWRVQGSGAGGDEVDLTFAQQVGLGGAGGLSIIKIVIAGLIVGTLLRFMVKAKVI